MLNVVSGLNIEKLLAIPKLPVSTGDLMGRAVVHTLQDWNGVPDWLSGLCFDTTSSNTGINTGAITVIQLEFDERLLFLACHDHIMEIILAAVFYQFSKSSVHRLHFLAASRNSGSSLTWQIMLQSMLPSVA